MDILRIFGVICNPIKSRVSRDWNKLNRTKMNVRILEILLYFPTLIIIFSVLILPFFINKRIKFLNHSKLIKILFLTLSSLIISGILTFAYTYWSIELSNNILLTNLGYNANGMNEYEYYQNVKPEYLKKAKEIRESQMGIGWPLKAIFSFVFLILPYEVIMSIIIGTRSKKGLQIITKLSSCPQDTR